MIQATKRLTACTSLVAFVVGSLITFPAYLHWMVTAWIIVSLIVGTFKKPMWPWLLGCIAILILKRPGYTSEYWILLCVLSLVAVVDFQKAPKSDDSLGFSNSVFLLVPLVLVNLFYGFARSYGSNTSHQTTADGRPIACLGDSLTDFGYPQELEKLISVAVVDFGVNGIETRQGIELIPEILKANPQLVVIELGGHDYNKGKSRSATQTNLEQLIRAFHEREISVVLVEIPRGFVADPFDGLERELAAKYDLQLIDDSVIRNLVFFSPIMPPGIWLDPSNRISDDGLHPNELGNKYFARVVLQALKRTFGDRIAR